jgi:hypothetical protein
MNTGQQTGNDTIMMDEMIVRMKDIRAVNAQLPGDLQYSARAGPSRFLKRSDLYA